MATYAIGDVQGCYTELKALLQKIAFNSGDTLWFTGDLVNRGPESCETLRFVRELQLEGRATIVLGNHDLGTLAILRGAEPFNSTLHTFEDLMHAKDRETLLTWLEQQPLIHHDKHLDFTLVHAGIYPLWSLEDALDYAHEVEAVLCDEDQKQGFYRHLYGNLPNRWHPGLSSYERLRFIVNSFTRMRWVDLEARLNLEDKESSSMAPYNAVPWFKFPGRKTQNSRILFGHWASLKGNTHEPNVFALDTGCVWGGALTAFRLQDQAFFSIGCLGHKRPV